MSNARTHNKNNKKIKQLMKMEERIDECIKTEDKIENMTTKNHGVKSCQAPWRSQFVKIRGKILGAYLLRQTLVM